MVLPLQRDSADNMKKNSFFSTNSPADMLGRALTTPANGVIGMVNELLTASLERSIRLVWQAGFCRVTVFGGGFSDEVEA